MTSWNAFLTGFFTALILYDGLAWIWRKFWGWLEDRYND